MRRRPARRLYLQNVHRDVLIAALGLVLTGEWTWEKYVRRAMAERLLSSLCDEVERRRTTAKV